MEGKRMRNIVERMETGKEGPAVIEEGRKNENK